MGDYDQKLVTVVYRADTGNYVGLADSINPDLLKDGIHKTLVFLADGDGRPLPRLAHLDNLDVKPAWLENLLSDIEQLHH